MSSFVGGGGSGGPGAAGGWEQLAGAPGVTQTTPINAPGGSGQAGPNVIMAPGNGDGAGNAGNVVLELAAGVQALGPAAIPNTGVIVLDGANQGNFVWVVQPATTGAKGQSLVFNAGVSNQVGGELDLYAGNSTGAFDGGTLNLQAGSSRGGIGGSILLQAGGDDLFLSQGGNFNAAAAAGFKGGDCVFFGGDGHNGGGGKVQFVGGPDLGVDGAGGFITFETGQGSGIGNGGDMTLTWGVSTGTGRAGLFFPNLPTTNPGVPGAMWCDTTDGNRIKIS